MTSTAAGTPPAQQGSAAASGLAVIGAIVTTAANFLVAWLVSRTGSELAGVFFVATAVITIAGNGSCLGTMTGMVYFLPAALAGDAPNPRSLLFIAIKPVIGVAATVSALVFFGAPGLADLVAGDEADDIAVMLRVLALTILPWALTVTLLGTTRGLGTMTPTVAIGQVLRPGLQIALLGLVFLVDGQPTPTALAAAWGLPVLLGFLAAVVSVARLGGLRSSTSKPVSSRDFWSYTRPRALSTALQIALERLDVILVSAFVGVPAAGVYGALTRYISAGNFLIFSVGQAVSAHLRRAVAAADWDAARGLLQRATGWLVLIAWPYFLLVGLKPAPLADLLNSEYVADARILSVLALGMLFSAAAGPIDLTLLMLGRSTASLVGVAVAIVADLLLLIVLTPSFGLMGAAIAWAASVAIQNGLASWFVHSESGLRAQARPAVVAAALAMIAVVPVALLTPNSLLGLLMAAVVVAVVLLIGAIRLNRALGLDELLPARLVSRLPGS